MSGKRDVLQMYSGKNFLKLLFKYMGGFFLEMVRFTDKIFPVW
jgi:hypothetical protein